VTEGHKVIGPRWLSASLVSTFEKGCRFVSGLLPFRFAHLEKLFSHKGTALANHCHKSLTWQLSTRNITRSIAGCALDRPNISVLSSTACEGRLVQQSRSVELRGSSLLAAEQLIDSRMPH
jgi:hypothetical protein